MFFSVYTLGCKLNQLETEAITDAFRRMGFVLISGSSAKTPSVPYLGLIVVNTCTVTSMSEQKARRLIRRLLKDYPGACLIITGCYAQLDADEIQTLETPDAESGCTGALGEKRLFVLGGGEGGGAGTAKSALLRLPGYLREAMADGSLLSQILESWVHSEGDVSPFSFRPGKFTFHSRGYLKIQDGCDSACAYCRVRFARGPSVSLPREAALRELLSFEASGCAELTITGVNISQYRHSGCDLAGLLEYLLEGSSRIALRLSSLEPEGIDERLASVLSHPRIRPHFHLSVQSGSSPVLQKMGRAYDPQKVVEGAALLRSAKDNPFLACDIIAGFPSETEAEFARTVELCEKIRFAWIHAFPFSKRPGTAAFSFEGKVCERDVTQRVAALGSLALRGRRDYAQAWLGKELSAVVEKGKTAQGQCRAVSGNYLRLLVSYIDEAPPPGSSVRCIPVSLCEGADGETPDAAAIMHPNTYSRPLPEIAHGHFPEGQVRD